MPIKQITKKNISTEVFDQIKNNIISGEWRPGDKIPSENELGNLFGVSRVSIRAALQKLCVLGLLTTRHGEGTFVSDLSPDMYMNSLIPILALDETQLVEVLEFRRIIEVESVKLAAQRAQDEDIKELEEIVRIMKESTYDPKKFAEEDSFFHETLVKSAKNPIIYKVNTIIKDILLSHQIKIQEIMGPTLALKYHPAILEAVKKGDSELASKLMEEHIRTTIESVQKTRESDSI
ncbi:MAG: transcriptional regulator, GntR family [Clostridiales bacterium]|jgi:GntR family transcriptional repressor for pyruvate dehydrogenase complex|nr:transcriptional regulator, GntR family [Clostridiales bacterium]MDF2891162.1 transcriptional regulator, GntR family [Clostridia bacterium]